MSVLRVLVAAAPSPAQEVPWAMYDAQQRLQRSGVGTAATWPSADRREAVLAASAVRLARVTLPPMPADRVAAAAAFALEDQLAGPAQAQHLVASPRSRDGAVEVAIAARALFDPLRETFARVVAEPAIAPVPPAGVWRWYSSGAAGGFVRRTDGSAFAVSAPRDPGPSLPSSPWRWLRRRARARRCRASKSHFRSRLKSSARGRRQAARHLPAPRRGIGTRTETYWPQQATSCKAISRASRARVRSARRDGFAPLSSSLRPRLRCTSGPR